MVEPSILVVCLGNVCRSPVAERLLRMRLDSALDGTPSAVQVSSAGVRALVGAPIDPLAAAELRRLGGDPSGFASTQLTPAMVTSADLVLTATRQLRSRVLEDAPRALRRTFTLREFAALNPAVATTREPPGDVPDGAARTPVADLVSRAAAARARAGTIDQDVPDPIGRDQAFHRHVADLLAESCAAIAQAVADAVLPPTDPS